MKIDTNCEQETIDLAVKYSQKLLPTTMLLLSGDLGAGKTCFVRGLCEGLGGNPMDVNSPTFTIVQEYPIANGKKLIHIDAYRLSGEEELETIGFEELCVDPEAIIAIEWPERIASALPIDAVSISIEHLSDQRRSIVFGG